MLNEHLGGGPKLVVDTLSVGVVFGTLADVLPSIAALFSAIWAMIQIYETKTCQRAIARVRGRAALDE